MYQCFELDKCSMIVIYTICLLTHSSIYTYFNTLKKKAIGKHLWEKVKLLKMSNFTFSKNVFFLQSVS